MEGSRSRSGWRWIVLASFLLGLTALTLGAPSVGLGKEFEIDGTVDCGERNGRACPIGDTLALWTDDISGTLARVVIDVSWIRRQLERRAPDQGDLLCIQVEDKPEGGLRAIGLVDVCDVEGTINRGLSRRGDDVSEQPKRDDDDEDDEFIEPTTTPTPTPTPTSTRTPLADLAASKSTRDDRVDSFEPTIFSIHLRNVGEASASDVVFEDRIIFPPAPTFGYEFEFFFEFGSFLSDCGVFVDGELVEGFIFVDDVTKEFVVIFRCTGTFPQGADNRVRMGLAFVHDEPEPLTIRNEAHLDPEDEIEESDEGNNVGTARTRVNPFSSGPARATSDEGRIRCSADRPTSGRFEFRCERDR